MDVRLPPTMLLRRGRAKGILKDLLGTRMGHYFANRTKMGFTPPLGDWLRQEETSRWVEQCLTDKE